MARKTTTGLTQRESEIMDSLWDLGTASSEEIRIRLTGDPHDSSVRTLLRILVEKGYVVSNAGTRPTQYRAAVPKAKAQKTAIGNLLDRMFGGSAEAMVVRMLEDKKLTVEQLEEIRNSISQTRKGPKS